jgi:hypothetical protein
MQFSGLKERLPCNYTYNEGSIRLQKSHHKTINALKQCRRH